MKKVVAVLLSLMMIFSLTGCVGKTSQEALREQLKEELKEELKAEMQAEKDTDVDSDVDKEKDADADSDVNMEKDADAKAEDMDTDADVEKEKESKKTIGTVETTDWKSMTFSLDGTVYTLPFSYSEIADDWKFDLSDYGYVSGYIMNKGDKVSSTVGLENAKYEAEMSVGFINNDDSSKDITECDIWSFGVSTIWDDTYPEIVLPGGITWGSTKEEIYAVYGEPEEEPYRAEELGYYVYEYYHDYTERLRLVVYDDGGLKEIDYSIY